jgi:predicted unusual protein kinase regulating ubiquinone biosynthesis (AarF/ABC1/UbiB family)
MVCVHISHDGTKFILFDVGIVNEYSYDDHSVLIDVLSAFIRKDGRKAGRRMIDDSNMKFVIAAAASSSGASSKKVIADMALNEEQYIDKIELLTRIKSFRLFNRNHIIGKGPE